MRERMYDRQVSEIDLRMMFGAARALRAASDDRWIVETRLRQRAWRIVVEPDFISELLVVITAYPVE